MGGAVACAIVGVVQDNTAADPVDYVASLPGGYIEIANRAGINSGVLPSSWAMPVPDQNNLFNNELGGVGPQVYSTNSGGQTVFSTDSNALQAWAAYNATNVGPGNAGTDAQGAFTGDATYGRDARLGPPPVTGIYTAQGNGSQPATINDLLGLNSAPGSSCYQQLMNTGWLNGACDNANSFANAYGRDLGNGGGGGLPSGITWSAIDALKLEVINSFQGNTNLGSHGGVTVDGNNPGGVPLPPAPASDPPGSPAGTGFGVYPTGVKDWGHQPPIAPIPLEEPTGTAMGMLNQVQSEGGACVSTVLADIAQRCKEIYPAFGGNNPPNSPACTAAVAALLNSQPLQMGHTMYIHMVDPLNPATGLTYGPAGTWTHSTLVSAAVPDGPPGGGPGACATAPINLVWQSPDSFVDSFSPNGSDGGDNNLHEAPFRSFTGDLTATDHADFILSSGYQNLLGKLDFYQTTTGSESFSRPN